MPYCPHKSNSKRKHDRPILLSSSPSEADLTALKSSRGNQLEPSWKTFSEILKNLFGFSDALGETWLDRTQFGFPTTTTPPHVTRRDSPFHSSVQVKILAAQLEPAVEPIVREGFQHPYRFRRSLVPCAVPIGSLEKSHFNRGECASRPATINLGVTPPLALEVPPRTVSPSEFPSSPNRLVPDRVPGQGSYLPVGIGGLRRYWVEQRCRLWP